MAMPSAGAAVPSTGHGIGIAELIVGAAGTLRVSGQCHAGHIGRRRQAQAPCSFPCGRMPHASPAGPCLSMLRVKPLSACSLAEA